MNLVYALGAYPLGRLSDRMDHGRLLALGGVLVLMARGALAPPRHHAPGTHPGGGAP